VVRRPLLFRGRERPGEILCSLRSRQNIALVLCGVLDRGRPPSLGTASQRDGCSLPATRITGWRRACSRLMDRTCTHEARGDRRKVTPSRDCRVLMGYLGDN